MAGKEKETHPIFMGVIIGGIIGGITYSLIKTVQENHKPVLSKIGEIVSEMGDILEEKGRGKSDEALHEIEKNIPKGEDMIRTALTWVTTGLSLWNRYKKGI